MAYGRFGGGSQSNLRSVDAGQARANKKDQERNVTIPKVVLPVKKKKKPVTLMGMTVTAPKSDVQKKIDSGQATVIATKSSGKIVTTPTQDNKSLIMSKATQQKTAKEYKDSTANLAEAKPAIGKAIKKFDNAGENFSDFMGTKSQQQKQLESKTGGTPLPSGLTGANVSTGTVKKTKLSPITGDGSGVAKIDTPVSKPKINKTAGINSGSLIYDFNKRMYGSYQGTKLTERQFLKDKNVTTPTVSSLIGSIGSSVKNIGSWWRNAGDAQLKKNKQMNNVIKNQLGLSAGKSQF